MLFFGRKQRGFPSSAPNLLWFGLKVIPHLASRCHRNAQTSRIEMKIKLNGVKHDTR